MDVGPIQVNADAVICHAGDVDIASFGCELTFGTTKVELTGRKANELFATIGEAGVSPDGAAGTIYEGLHALSRVIDTAGIARRDGVRRYAQAHACQRLFAEGPGPYGADQVATVLAELSVELGWG